jgi:hypothetical protein
VPKPVIKWSAMAPDGYRFDVGGPHELLVVACVVAGPCPRQWKADAKRELLERIANEPLVECTDPDCDWFLIPDPRPLTP